MAAETRKQKLARWRKERARRWKQIKAAKARLRADTTRVQRLNRAIAKVKAQLQPVPPSLGGWHPGAQRVPYSPGSYTIACPPKGVLHTTEGYGLPNYAGSNPTFTLVLTGPGYLRPKLYQHIPIQSAAKALRHTESTPTNGAHAIQIELGNAFAGKIGQLKDQDYTAIANLMRWIERHGGVLRRSNVRFAVPAQRLSNSAWINTVGWVGHEHVPQNDHWDPGSFDIARVL